MKYLLLIIAGLILLIFTCVCGRDNSSNKNNKDTVVNTAVNTAVNTLTNTAVIVLVTFNDSLEFMNSVKNNSMMTDLDTTVMLYNKNKAISNVQINWRGQARSLENVGMDVYGYIVYIVENYKNLPNVLFFINGGTDKSQAKQSKLAHLLNNWQSVYSQGYVDPEPQPAISDFYLDEWETNNALNRNPNHSKLTPAIVRPFRKWYESFVGPWENVEKSGVSFMNILAVRRDRVLQHNIDLYAQLKYQLEIGGLQSEVAHYIERTFRSLFIQDWKRD